VKTILSILHSFCILYFFFILAPCDPCQAEPFDNTLKTMQQKFQSLKDYQCVFESYTARDEESREMVFSYFFKKPKMIRMEVLEGTYPGTVMLYNPQVMRDKVRVLVGNPALAVLQKIFFGEYFGLYSKWIIDLRGNGVHESDWGSFIDDHLKLLHLGKSKFIGEKEVNGRTTLFYRLDSHEPIKTMNIKTEEVWIDKKTYFPIKYIHYDASDQVIRRSVYHNLKFNTDLQMDLFKRLKTDSR
jgi:outer membrane lipoprotein-sorting protein